MVRKTKVHSLKALAFESLFRDNKDFFDVISLLINGKQITAPDPYPSDEKAMSEMKKLNGRSQKVLHSVRK